jgi:hypothetical protein
VPFIYDAEKSRIIDTDTGESFRAKSDHWQDPYLHCTIYAADGSPLFAAEVEDKAVDQTGGRGAATLVHYVVREAWLPSGKPEKPTLFLGPTEMIDRLRAFLLARHHLGPPKTPDPRFEFSDGRGAAREVA